VRNARLGMAQNVGGSGATVVTTILEAVEVARQLDSQNRQEDNSFSQWKLARHWRLQRHRYALVGEVCNHCGEKIFPARDVCPQCNAPAKTPFTFSGKGEVYSYSTVHNPPEGVRAILARMWSPWCAWPRGAGGRAANRRGRGED